MVDVITMQELWKQDVDGYMPVLMEVYNPDIKWTAEEQAAYEQDNSYIRLIADESRVRYKGKTYLPCAFDFNPPEVDGKKIGTASITISALDTRVKRLLRSIELPSEIRIVSLFAKTQKDGTTGAFIYQFAELNSAPFKMTSASSNKTTATFNLTFGKNMGQNIPYDVATPDRVPGTRG